MCFSMLKCHTIVSEIGESLVPLQLFIPLQLFAPRCAMVFVFFFAVEYKLDVDDCSHTIFFHTSTIVVLLF